MPPIGGYDWRVRVYHRASRVCRTLFTPGRAIAATSPDVADAVTAAIGAVNAAIQAGTATVREGPTP